LRRANLGVRSYTNRSGRRHHRHLASLSLSRRRADAQRGDQPPARAWIEARPDERVELVSEDIDKQENLSFDQLPTIETLPLLAKLAHRFGARGIRLTTRGESPAGAGIAGSSALNVRVCGALAAYTGRHRRRSAARYREGRRSAGDQGPDRPAGLSARVLRRHRRVELQPDSRSRAARRRSARARARIVLCYTGEPRNSGTNNWDITKRHIDGDQHIFDCFERIRDTAAAMREALTRGDLEPDSSRPATEWRTGSAPRLPVWTVIAPPTVTRVSAEHWVAQAEEASRAE
jgi:D-glycero-alpha-D-manno-heptose-7-phosphate kinase